MLKALLQKCRIAIANVERTLFLGKFPPGLNFADVVVSPSGSSLPKKFSIEDFMGDNILWAVQKHRRTLEKRMLRKFGSVEGVSVYKLHLPQKDLLVCVHCGHDYKRGYLCKNCYTKVMDETKRMQEKIKEELKLNPIEEEIIVLYKGEKEEKPSEFWNGKRIVEMPEERPSWFSRNLLQKTTSTTSDSKDIKPDHLG